MGDEIDPETVKAEMDGITDAIDRFQTIRGKCTSMENSVHDIRETLSEIEDTVTRRVTRLEGELGTETG